MPRQGPEHTSGPIPYGWDLDREHHLVPSRRPARGRHTETDEVRAVFEGIAAGGNPYAEAKRLNAEGVPAPVRYAGQEEPVRVARWRPTRIAQMVRNPLYRRLVGGDLFARANAVLDRRRVGRRATRPYPLTGLIVCGECGSTYVGQTQRWRGWAGGARRYYACGAARSAVAYGDRSCRARAIPAEWLEAVATEVAGDGRPTRIRVDQSQREGREFAVVTLDADARSATRTYRYSARRRA